MNGPQAHRSAIISPGNALILLGLIAGIALYHAARGERSAPAPDDYAKFAYAVATWGTFGFPDDSTRAPAPSVGRAPLYPLFLAGMMQLSPTYASLVTGYVDGEETTDEPDAGIVPYVQMAIMATVAFVLFAIARLFGSRPVFAHACAAVALVPLLDIAFKYRLSEALAVPLFALASLCLVLWFMDRDRPRRRYLFLAGLVLGLAALTRTVHVTYLPFVLLAVLLLPTAAGGRPAVRRRLAGGLLLLAGFAIVVAPWVGRNVALQGSPAIGAGGADGVLAWRAAYNTMSPAEALAAGVYWLPGFGDSLARSLFPERAWRRLDFSHPDGFRARGWATLQQVRRDHADGGERRAELRRLVLADPAGHLVATLPLAVRGLRHVWIFLPFAVYALWRVRRQPVFPPLIGAGVLTVATFVVHAGITHFRGRYGLPMVVGFAPLAALGLTILSGWRSGEARRSDPLLQ